MCMTMAMPTTKPPPKHESMNADLFFQSFGYMNRLSCGAIPDSKDPQSTSIRYRFDAKVSNWCLIDVDWGLLLPGISHSLQVVRVMLFYMPCDCPPNDTAKTLDLLTVAWDLYPITLLQMFILVSLRESSKSWPILMSYAAITLTSCPQQLDCLFHSLYNKEIIKALHHRWFFMRETPHPHPHPPPPPPPPLVKLPSGECQKTSLISNQGNGFMSSGTNVDRDVSRHVTSPGHNKLTPMRR